MEAQLEGVLQEWYSRAKKDGYPFTIDVPPMGPVPAKGDGPSIPKDEVPATRPREEEPKNLWRLTVPRWTEIIHKCDKCHRLNMLNKQRVVTDATGMTVITTLLQDCCRDANLRMSDVYFQNFKWAKKEEGTG